MKKTIVLACSLIASTNVLAAGKAHWGYSGEVGPSNWATLSADNFACSGKNQSPINLTGFIESELAPIAFSYREGGNEIINNGHTVQVNYEAGSYIIVDGISFDLLQFHFHAPSENHIEGKSYPLEAHLVHSDSNGNLAVVAIMFEEGRENAALAGAWASLPIKEGDNNVLADKVNAYKVLPENRDHYRFDGSLTTPPCSEGVRWLVMKESISASKEQIAKFKEALHEPNNRPIQAVNARTVLK